MKKFVAVFWRLLDLALSAGFPPYKYRLFSDKCYERTYSLHRALRETTGYTRSAPSCRFGRFGCYYIVGPFGQIFTFCRSSSGPLSANQYDQPLARRLGLKQN